MKTAPEDKPILVYGEMRGGEDHKVSGPKRWAVSEWGRLSYAECGNARGHFWVVESHGQYYSNYIHDPQCWAELPPEPTP